jgi:ABC-2 type transport system permease protein
MRAGYCLWKKELAGCFLSPIAYVMTFCFLMLTGLSFWWLANLLAFGESLTTARQWIFGSPVLWFSMPVLIPLLTMRLFAEEKRMGTMELLLTAPVSEVAVVLAKFFGALGFFIFMWMPTLLYVAVLRYLLPESGLIDAGTVVSGYFGMLLIGAFFIAVGMLTSALTSNQVVAAVLSFALLCFVFFMTLFAAYGARGDEARAWGEMFCSYVHALDFSRGLLDSRPVVFYLTATGLLLFINVRVLEARRWK